MNDSETTQQLCRLLRTHADELDQSGRWPAAQLRVCAEAGVFRWFIDPDYGGWGWNDRQILEGYLALSQCCLTTSFVLTQWNAACRRIAASPNGELRARLLPQLASGDVFATVGISHLSTSRQHVGRPVLSATPQPDGSLLLNGFSAWVTGAAHADQLVVGATLPDDKQILCCVARNEAGLKAHPGQQLVALTSSCTDKVDLANVRVSAENILVGPIENVMQSGGGGTGGLQTSTLAIGLSLAAIDYLSQQSKVRSELVEATKRLSQEAEELRDSLFGLAESRTEGLSAGELRTRANSLALRATQAALTAAKGAGFAADHPVGRWAREALFFLVWSCPQPVLAANLREFAQIASDDCQR
jgi:alkylation response protein AidB-like acyl-CoA dehydrogenase